MSVELPGEVASLGRRAGALVIDWLACLLVAKLLAPALELGEAPFLPLAIFFLEVTLLTWFVAASFGQRLFRIEVIGIDGQRLMLWRIIVRTALICLVIPAVVFDSDGRGLHDRAIGSVAILRKRSN
ncbi:MAG: RDD family protein [Actinobacteria bacterium]|nr:RDD family protein [Actinomycetota bacterium]